MEQAKINELASRLLKVCLAEDAPDGDQSTLASIPAEKLGRGRLIAKEDGVLAGMELGKAMFHLHDPSLEINLLKGDGDSVSPMNLVMELGGRLHSLLLLERSVLNIMQRMSGIATLTREFVRVLDGTNCRILDTRKTAPGLRKLDKWAVRIGGGHNHRMGLSDMIMLKDNHVDGAGGIRQAILKTAEYQKAKGQNLPVEIETRSLDEVAAVLEIGQVTRIMFDNFSPELVRKGVAMVGGRFETEASGKITLSNARAYGETGVDFISSGQISHTVDALDLSLKIK